MELSIERVGKIESFSYVRSIVDQKKKKRKKKDGNLATTRPVYS